MIRKYNGYKPQKIGTGREILPAGGYVAEIVDAHVERTEWGERLILSFDIVEGEYLGFFAKDYASAQGEMKKWRGVYRASIPQDDGTERDGWSKRTFDNLAASFEESNPGYVWNWDEATLKGKRVGVLFRNKEWEIDGRTGWTTECSALTDVNSIREGNYKVPKDKPLSGQSTASQSYTAAPPHDDDDFPF